VLLVVTLTSLPFNYWLFVSWFIDVLLLFKAGLDINDGFVKALGLL